MTDREQLLDDARNTLNRDSEMITGSQIRAGRALLGWSIERLAQEAGTSESSVRRAETAEGIPPMRADNLGSLQGALERGGCLFLDVGDIRTGGEGVRRRRQ